MTPLCLCGHRHEPGTGCTACEHCIVFEPVDFTLSHPMEVQAVS